MGIRFSKLRRIENLRNITEEKDENFLFQIKRGLLLALGELGVLNPMQLRQAEQKLQKRRTGQVQQQQ